MGLLFFLIAVLALVATIITAIALVVKALFMPGRVKRSGKTLLKFFFASFIICFILSIVLSLNSATSSVENDNSNSTEEVSDTEDTNEGSYNADSNSGTTSEETSDPEIGTRTNPYPFNTPVEMSFTDFDNKRNEFTGSLEITILSSERGKSAFKTLFEAHDTSPAPKGYEWVLLKINVAYTKSDSQNDYIFISDNDFTLVSESGDIYSGDIRGRGPEPELDFEMYVGNEKAGYAAYLVKKGESALLRFDDNEYFFAIE